MEWWNPEQLLQWFNRLFGARQEEPSGASAPERPAWFRFPIGELFVELRRQGFSIGVDTLETSLCVITKAIETGDEARLDLWLCPVLAHTPEQQAIFREVYRRLFIPALDAARKKLEKPEGHQESLVKKHEREANPPRSDDPVERSRAEESRQKVVASLKARTSDGMVLDRFVRTTGMTSDPVLLRVVRQLRFTREFGRYDFDIRRTVATTVRNGGFATPVFTPRRHHVEYLMLIDRHNDRDHRAHLHNSLYETLRENNIFVERFWFDNSPLICRNDHHSGGIRLDELLSLYGHSVLLLFADGLQFIDTREQALFEWTALFSHWQHRFFVSSVPPVLWGRRETLLRELFPVLLPLSTEGIRTLADDLDQDGGDCDWVRYWQEGADYSLVPLRIEGKALEEIALFFSRPMQRWIAACAVWPELNWNLTLALGEWLSRRHADGEPLNAWRNVSRLLRLDWFIRGRIPDAFRLQLIGVWLDRTDVAAISRFLHEQLAALQKLPDEPGYAEEALQLAVYDFLGEENPEERPEKRNRLHKRLEEARTLPDIVTLHYAATEAMTPLDFEIPELLLKRLGVDLRALKRGAEPTVPENFVLIKGEQFTMGSPEGEADRFSDETQHEVKVSDFAMCRYAVTVAEFRQFMEVSGYRTDAEKENSSRVFDGKSWVDKKGINWRHGVTGTERPKAEENHPVLHVSWNDAMAYCDWLSKRRGGLYRLPTEAEWEYACRSGTTTPFSTGENLTTDQANYDGYYPYGNYPKGEYRGKTVSVDSFEPNGYGLYNMHGNVWEWCSDWFGNEYYKECRERGVVENPRGPETGSNRVLRGGGWNSGAQLCRSADRTFNGPGSRISFVGFRLVFVPQFKA